MGGDMEQGTGFGGCPWDSSRLQRLMAVLLIGANVAACTATSATASPTIFFQVSTTPTATPAPTPIPTPAVTAPPSSAPGFGPTGSMATGRSDHYATLLSDGRVLLVGGYNEPGVSLASAELYDPRTSTFNPTGSMRTARHAPFATPLSDGRVLIGGGCVCDPLSTLVLASAELYDPRTGSFIATGSMTTGRVGATATLLSDGRILIAGGTGSSRALASAELYDPPTGTFNPTGSMGTSRSGSTATLLADGRVLVVGGMSDGYTVLASAELYDPQSGKFTMTGSMEAGRINHTATLLADGRVLMAGGTPSIYSSAPILASAELYDPKSGSFSPTGSMETARTYHTATRLSDGRVLVAGGSMEEPEVLASAELYNPTTGTFGPTGAMKAGREYHTATLLSDGRVLVAGGLTHDGLWTDSASAELYRP